MNDDNILKRFRDALATVAGQYGPVTDEQRNEWLALVQEHDAHGWAVVSEPLEAPVEDDPRGAVD